MKQKILKLIDRRTVITVMACSFLFLLAYKEIETRAAIDAIALIVIGLIGGNAAQRSFIAFARRSSKKPKKDAK